MKTILFGALGLLALAVVPVSGHAQMPGQPCQMAQVGTTKLADDRQSIIGCLETGAAQKPAIWKSYIGGGGSSDWQCSGYAGGFGCIRPSDGTTCVTIDFNPGKPNRWGCTPALNWPG